MGRAKLIKIVPVLVFLCLSANVHAQKKPKSPEKQHEGFLKQQAEREKENTAKLDEDRKKHIARQDKTTQKRMKTNKKRSNRMADGKHDRTLLQRLFTKKGRGR
jgi:hypothetical protein